MNYNYSYHAGGGAAAVFFTLVWLAFAVLTIVGLWKTLSKAGLPGWAAIIPFYNEYNIVKMSNRPVYFFWIMLACTLFAWIPLFGFILIIGVFVLWVFIALDIAANFGQGTGFAILLIIFPWIMFLILGFGSYEYRRIAAPGSAGFGAPPMPAGGGYAAAPPPPPTGQQYVPPTPGQPMAPPPPLAQPVMPQPLAPPPSQATIHTPPPVQTAPVPTPPVEDVTPTPPPAEPAPPESPTPPPPPPPPPVS
ncbi:MAG TPA: DUF5684 domain-containing protein [Thermoleophilia bacterium]